MRWGSPSGGAGTGPSAGIAARPATAAQEQAADRLGEPRTTAAVTRSLGPATPVPAEPRLGAAVVGLDQLPAAQTEARAGDRVAQQAEISTGADRIYTARNRTREVISVAGGWAGATAAGAVFAAWYTPADTAGPWAWVGHGVGTLIAGGVGYFIGSETTTTVYELVVEDD